MRHRVKGKKFGRKKGHRDLMVSNLVTSLMLYEKITTTSGKAALVKSRAEKMLTIAKKNNLHARRIILSRLHSKMAVKKVFEDLNEQFKNRNSGFVRVVKIDNRPGDNSERCIVELIIKHKGSDAKQAKIKQAEGKKQPKEIKPQIKKTGLWDRLRGRGPRQQSAKAPIKKTIERTTSK